MKTLDKKEKKKTLGFVQKFFAGILLKYWKLITRALTNLRAGTYMHNSIQYNVPNL